MQDEKKCKTMLPGTSTEEEPDDAPRPFGADNRCFTECNYIFLFRKRFSFKSSYRVDADSAFIKGLLLQTQRSVDSCAYFLLLPYLWHLICNFCWVVVGLVWVFFFHWFHLSAVEVDAAWASVLMLSDLLGCRLGKPTLDYKIAS